jgi:hypothetical protein
MDAGPDEHDAFFQLSHLYLKKIVKENHNHTIRQLKFCETHPNLLATVGGTQASIYDNENCGEHLDIMMNFVNMDTPALLRILASCPKNPFHRLPAPDSSHSENPTLHINSHSTGSLPSRMNSFESRSKAEVDEFSSVQFKAMHAVINEGGFDEDIHVGMKDMINGSSKTGETRDENAVQGDNQLREKSQYLESLSTLPSASSVDILPNKRLIQGTGRDIELFDRSDRRLNSCAWVALPPRKLLPQPSVELLAKRLGTPVTKLNGTFDVDVSRVDRSDAWLAVGGEDGLVQLISVTFCKSLYVLPGHYEPITALASGRKSTCLASLSPNRIIVWNLPLIARHHYNATHSGGSGLEHITDAQEAYQTNGTSSNHTLVNGTTFTTGDALLASSASQHNLPPEHAKWVLQVLETPAKNLTCLEFTSFGLVAGSSTGQIYRWPFLPRSRPFGVVSTGANMLGNLDKSMEQIEEQRLNLLEAEMDDLGPRQTGGKRPAPGSKPRASTSLDHSSVPIWTPLACSLLEERCDFLDWPHKGEHINVLLNKSRTVESPAPAIAVRTTAGRLVVLVPGEHVTSIPTNLAPGKTHQPKLTTVQVLSEFVCPSSSSSIQTTIGSNSRIVMDESDDEEPAPTQQGLDISRCGLVAALGTQTGDVFLVELATGRIISKLEHKRSKGNITACVIARHTRNVAFVSDFILWRWDFLSPAFLQKEQAEQARAEAEGVDVAPSDPEDDVPDDEI